MEQPYAFALDDGSVVLKNTLDKFALKSDDFEFDKDLFNEKVNKRDIATKAGRDEESKQLREGQNTYSLYNLMRPPYPPRMLTTLKEINTYHSSAIKTKAVDTGGLGCKIVKIGDNENPNLEDKKKLEQFLRNCYPTPEDVFTRAAQDEEEIGWFGIEVIRVGGTAKGEPQRLEHVPSHTFRIHKDGNRFMHTWDGITRRWYKLAGDYRSIKDKQNKDIDILTGEEHPFDSLPTEKCANELIYSVNYSSGTTYYGTPDSIPAIRTMIGDQAAVNYNITFFKNFATPQYAVYITGNFKDQPILDDEGKPTGKSVLQRSIEDRFREVQQNPHGNMVFMIPSKGGADGPPITITFEKLSVDIKDSSFRMYREANRDEIISAHRVDPYRAMVFQKGNLGGGNTVSSIVKENYKETTINPKQRRIESLVNKNVIWNENGFNIKDWGLKLTPLNTEDKVRDAEIDTQKFLRGELSPNELRAKNGLERVDHPAMDAYYVGNNPITITQQEELPEEVAKVH